MVKIESSLMSLQLQITTLLLSLSLSRSNLEQNAVKQRKIKEYIGKELTNKKIFENLASMLSAFCLWC